MSRLQRTTHTTYCAYKSDCSHYSIPAAEGGICKGMAAQGYSRKRRRFVPQPHQRDPVRRGESRRTEPREASAVIGVSQSA